MTAPEGTLTTAEAALKLARGYHAFCDALEPYNPETARTIRRVAERFEEVVNQSAPEWILLSQLEVTRGWSRGTLRERAREFEPEGRARKNESGRWEIRRDAALEIPAKSTHQREEIPIGDLEAAAERLAREV